MVTTVVVHHITHVEVPAEVFVLPATPGLTHPSSLGRGGHGQVRGVGVVPQSRSACGVEEERYRRPPGVTLP
jgi:hypothetical protein